MTVKYPHIIVKLSGENGNAFNLIGICVREARKHNLSIEEIEKFKQEAMSSNYDNLLQTCGKWFDII